MRAGAAQVEPVDRHPVAGVAEERPPEEELVEARLGVERVAAGEAVVALEVDRRQDLAVRSRACRCPGATVSRDRITASPNASAPLAPVAVAERVRRVLGDARS